MNYCPDCGVEVLTQKKSCTKFGKTLVSFEESEFIESNDTSGLDYELLAFLFPLIGLILYFIWKDEKPVFANSLKKV